MHCFACMYRIRKTCSSCIPAGTDQVMLQVVVWHVCCLMWKPFDWGFPSVNWAKHFTEPKKKKSVSTLLDNVKFKKLRNNQWSFYFFNLIYSNQTMKRKAVISEIRFIYWKKLSNKQQNVTKKTSFNHKKL